MYNLITTFGTNLRKLNCGNLLYYTKMAQSLALSIKYTGYISLARNKK